jgi:hypothetical protein
MADTKLTLTTENMKSIARGAVVALSGAILLTVGNWLVAGVLDMEILKVSLGSAVGAVLVNIVRKFFSE